MVKMIIAPLTSYGVLEYLDALRDLLVDSLRRAGVKVEAYVWSEVLKPPIKCFNWERKQYLARCVINHIRSSLQLAGVNEDLIVIGIGYLDGYEDGLNFVFGEAMPGNSTALVFTRRLRQEYYGLQPDFNLYFNRLVKEVVHEVGHLLGLNHCSNQGCVMSFSNSVAEVDAKSRFFCEECTRKIRELNI